MYFPNITPVIGVTIVNVFLGMLWYSPWFMGSLWAKAHKFDLKKLKPTAWHYLASIFVSFLTVFVFAVLIGYFHVSNWKSGFFLGVCLWLGFVVTTHFSGVIWACKPLPVYFIDAAYHLLSLVMMGILLALWL